MPLVSAYYSNFDMQNIVKSINQKLEESILIKHKQFCHRNNHPIFLDYFLYMEKKTKKKTVKLPQGLFTHNNKNCKLCALYIKPCTNIKTSNNVIWYIILVYWQSENVIHFRKRTSCNYTTTYLGKTVSFRSCMNNYITDIEAWQTNLRTT